MIESEVRAEIAAALRTIPSLAGRTYGWDQAKVSPPAAIVDLPPSGTFDETYGRGMDLISYTFMVVVGKPSDQASADRLSAYLSGTGPESVKRAVDGFDYQSGAEVTVQSWETVVATLADVSYLAVQFTAEAGGKGA